MIRLSDHISRELCLELKATTKQEALQEIVAAVSKSGIVGQTDVFHQKILNREAQASTAIGLGVAIPHASHDGLKQITIAVGRSLKGIDFDAPDGSPVHLVFLIGITADRGQYLKVVARITWLVRNDQLRQEFFQAESAEALYLLLSKH
jgi:mannitol/fructose-specific phosphotransferase system IIA component (Ntr-type)